MIVGGGTSARLIRGGAWGLMRALRKFFTPRKLQTSNNLFRVASAAVRNETLEISGHEKSRLKCAPLGAH